MTSYRPTAMLLAGIALSGCGDTGSTEDVAQVPGSMEVHGDTIIVAGAPMCDSCEIMLDSLAVLGAAGDPTRPGTSSMVVRTADGRLWVSQPVDAPGMAEYASDGSFVRVVGEHGEGLGEYRVSPTSIALFSGDSLLVYDPSLRRFSILDRPVNS